MAWDDEDSVDVNREKLKQDAIEQARLYTVFEQDARARALLEHWEKIAQRNIPPTASHAEFAYAEGQRVFVKGIRQQIEFARQNA